MCQHDPRRKSRRSRRIGDCPCHFRRSNKALGTNYAVGGNLRLNGRASRRIFPVSIFIWLNGQTVRGSIVGNAKTSRRHCNLPPKAK